jgi:hypothetical protein
MLRDSIVKTNFSAGWREIAASILDAAILILRSFAVLG